MERRVIAEKILKDWRIKGRLNSEEFEDKRNILQNLAEEDIPEFIDNLSQKLNKKSIKKPERLIKNLAISVLAPIVLIFLSFFIAFKYIEVYSFGLSAYNLGPYDVGGPSFEFYKDTVYIWLLMIVILVSIENKLYKARKKFKSFTNKLHKILFYFSFILTVLAIISFLLTLNVQLNSRLGRSTRPGFLKWTFLFLHTPAAISWAIYYLAVFKADLFYKLKIRSLKLIKNLFLNPKKRNKAIRQLKEAKDLLDLGVISEEEYKVLIEQLKPLIKP